jgi:hypothetical protein
MIPTRCMLTSIRQQPRELWQEAIAYRCRQQARATRPRLRHRSLRTQEACLIIWDGQLQPLARPAVPRSHGTTVTCTPDALA